ncbi:MAG: cysteine dioxygenase family protein [Acidobacteriota bacterium]
MTVYNDLTANSSAPGLVSARPCRSECRELQALFARLDVFEERIPLSTLRRELESLVVSVEDLATACCFADDRYVRNRLHVGPAYEALLVCWRPGQESPVHDHAGSSCAFRVLGGDADEVVFTPEDGAFERLVPESDRRLPAGFVCAAQDADIHQVRNHRSGLDLVTLHIYSPALTSMQIYPTPAS